VVAGAVRKMLRRQTVIHILEDISAGIHGCCFRRLDLVSFSVLDRSASDDMVPVIGLLSYCRVAATGGMGVLCEPGEYGHK
jgi:hypothetical protein